VSNYVNCSVTIGAPAGYGPEIWRLVTSLTREFKGLRVSGAVDPHSKKPTIVAVLIPPNHPLLEGTDLAAACESLRGAAQTLLDGME
jgi:hypothetical protein